MRSPALRAGLAAHLKFETGWTFTMSRLEAYRDSFHNARLARSKSGVLEVALHTDGGTLVFDGHTHEQFVDLFHTIGSDPDNRVVILTGTGQDHHAIVRVGTDGVKEIDELFMGVPIKDERAAISVQRHFQHTTFRACKAGVVEAVAIGF